MTTKKFEMIGDERSPSCHRRYQITVGRSGCHYALLPSIALRYRPPCRNRTRSGRVDGKARVRIGHADERKHEPKEARRPDGV